MSCHYILAPLGLGIRHSRGRPVWSLLPVMGGREGSHSKTVPSTSRICKRFFATTIFLCSFLCIFGKEPHKILLRVVLGSDAQWPIRSVINYYNGDRVVDWQRTSSSENSASPSTSLRLKLSVKPIKYITLIHQIQIQTSNISIIRHCKGHSYHTD